jgi:hypothetical protein
MHLVGSDTIAVVDGLGVPAGRRHAVPAAGPAAPGAALMLWQPPTALFAPPEPTRG